MHYTYNTFNGPFPAILARMDNVQPRAPPLPALCIICACPNLDCPSPPNEASYGTLHLEAQGNEPLRTHSKPGVDFLSNNETELRANIFHHISNPITRWKADHTPPIKMTVQLLKSFCLVAQVCVCVCVCVHMCVYVCVHVYMSVHMYIFVYTLYICVHMYVYMCVYLNVHSSFKVNMHTHMLTHISPMRTRLCC